MSDAEILASEHAIPGAVSPPVGQGHGVQGAHVHGMSDKGYVQIAIALAVITAIEVAWSYIHWGDGAAIRIFEVGGLLFMMSIKFVVVASRFMHLRFDDKLLARIFYAGLSLAVIVYVAALLMFHVFQGSHPITRY